MTMFTGSALCLLSALAIFVIDGMAFTYPASGKIAATRTLKPTTLAPPSFKKTTDHYQFSSATRLFISRDEDEEFFQPEMDRKSFKEKLPIAIGVFIGFSLPFVIGLAYLYANK